MSTTGSDGRLSIHAYLDALRSVEVQFALIRYALKTLPETKIHAFFNEHLQHQLSEVGAAFEWLKQRTPTKDYSRAREVTRDALLRKHKKQNRPADSRFKRELSEDRLNQSELLLLVAHFESFMKDIHETFLTADPAKVFGKRDSNVMLRELFDTQCADRFAYFLKELTIKEVKCLDHQRVKKRAEYFAKHYGVSFGSTKEVEELEEIMERRNRIAHEIYSPPPSSPEQIRDCPLVGDNLLTRARYLFEEIPRKCILAGAQTYKSHFV